MTREKRVRCCTLWDYPHSHSIEKGRETCPLEADP